MSLQEETLPKASLESDLRENLSKARNFQGKVTRIVVLVDWVIARVTTPQDYVTAEAAIRNSPEFSQRIANRELEQIINAEVRIPLERIYGADYKHRVRGFTRIASVEPPEVKPTDFSDGNMILRVRNERGRWKTVTMFPQPGEP